ncbi:hypothetical protein FOA43_004568 [Brettanomyces nanus]|uniref:GB1/RHD3-type G domain-containing protein n=1 Tax=Eeniella nana TaxID=13502 RepID=A0A875SBS4_EENNA|nr:uncharacterized protein FOA43_004568 [Brettanomyces nanus]QPG77162.1 hypothetical protein FOA43_004568 [Brettanomyces nanus]
MIGESNQQQTILSRQPMEGSNNSDALSASTVVVPKTKDLEPVQSSVSLQLIDDTKHFNEDLLSYIQNYSDANDNRGLNYHIVSVFGSQSTGKSTLLNRLFGTKFDVMDEHNRQQTTKGIWFSHANYISSDMEPSGRHPNSKHIFVLDVEGVDGHEKADDKDFERKSALFALASTEILIVNIWEHQVGLYQGANMELLKTVMEVNLSLFHGNKQKCLLLFVVRDFTGVTPLDNLTQSLRSDLDRIWLELNKPDDCKDEKLSSYFDLGFFSVAHKHFQPENFETDIRKLGDEFFGDNRLFKPDYHRGIPIDAWAIYSCQIWEQIELNKDLDLPTQQILVARFRCDEISSQAYESFQNLFNGIGFSSIKETNSVVENMNELRNTVLDEYESQASRYQVSVYEERKKTLLEKVDLKLNKVASDKLEQLSKRLLAQFGESVINTKRSSKSRNKRFGDILNDIVDEDSKKFEEEAGSYCISENFNFEKHISGFHEALNEASELLKLKEKDMLVSRSTKRFQSKLKEILIELLSDPKENTWDQALEQFHLFQSAFFDRYKLDDGKGYDLRLGLSEQANEATVTEIQRAFWTKFRDIIHDFMSEDTAARILRNKFEDEFKYDGDGIPNMWRNVTEIDQQFSKARANTISLLPILSVAKLSVSGEEIIPDIDISHDNDTEEELFLGETDNLEPSDKSHFFGHLLTTSQQNKVLHKLKKEIDAIYIDAKRSVIANRTSIPWWMYALVVTLGWNEFMAVLRNPMLVIMIVVGTSILFIAYHMQMLGPMASVGRVTLLQARTVAKQKLRDILFDEELVSVKEANEGSLFDEKKKDL